MSYDYKTALDHATEGELMFIRDIIKGAVIDIQKGTPTQQNMGWWFLRFGWIHDVAPDLCDKTINILRRDYNEWIEPVQEERL